jgi:S1-C subfamily serine protease
VKHGVLITDVKAFSKAEDQRLFVGLVIIEADKEEINNVNDLKSAIEQKKGKALLLKVLDQQGNNRFVGLEIPE